MRVSIIGTGYVGLVTGACLAHKGHQVICVDVDRQKVELINQATPTIYEQGLEALLQKHVGHNLRATTDLPAAVISTDVTLIAVGTPFDGRAIDLTYIREAARQIGAALREKLTYHLVVVKSTVVPGTTDHVVLPLLERASGKRAGVDFGVGMNPEFLSEGQAIQDFMHPDRIVLGGIDESSIDVLQELYSIFDGADLLRTNNQTAEMIKYTSNALQATLISFSNEIANLCATLGSADVVDVMRGVHLSNFLSPIMPNGERIVAPVTSYIQAGCGFGGSCFPKDVKALIAFGQQAGSSMQLMEAVIRINEQQPLRVIALLKKHFPTLQGVHVALLGLAFKPQTDDVRESPAIPIIRELVAEQAIVKAYDPVANDQARNILGDTITYCDDLAQAVESVHAVVLITRWDEFKNIPRLLEHLVPQPVLIDGRRMLDQRAFASYEGIGR
jgi:UDPglucose 6-dehydrogenase/GDP-mannose 6-dehydrogenase